MRPQIDRQTDRQTDRQKDESKKTKKRRGTSHFVIVFSI